MLVNNLKNIFEHDPHYVKPKNYFSRTDFCLLLRYRAYKKLKEKKRISVFRDRDETEYERQNA